MEKRSGRQRYSTRDERVHLYVGKKLFVFSPFRKCTYRYVTRYNYTCNSSISNFQDRGCSRIKITRGASAKDNDAARREVPKVLVARRETERWREGGSSARFQLYSSPRLSLLPKLVPSPNTVPTIRIFFSRHQTRSTIVFHKFQPDHDPTNTLSHLFRGYVFSGNGKLGIGVGGFRQRGLVCLAPLFLRILAKHEPPAHLTTSFSRPTLRALPSFLSLFFFFFFLNLSDGEIRCRKIKSQSGVNRDLRRFFRSEESTRIRSTLRRVYTYKNTYLVHLLVNWMSPNAISILYSRLFPLFNRYTDIYVRVLGVVEQKYSSRVSFIINRIVRLAPSIRRETEDRSIFVIDFVGASIPRFHPAARNSI